MVRTNGGRVRKGWRVRGRSAGTGGVMRAATVGGACILAGFGQAGHGHGFTGQAGSSLSGRVVDGNSGDPIPEAAVMIQGIGQQVADAQGRFRFEAVPEGSWVLRVQHMAFGDQEREVTMGSEALWLTVHVFREPIRLAAVQVEAMSRGERERRGTGHRINRIERDEIQGYEGTSMTLVDLITARIPGVHATRSGLVGQPVCVEFRGARSGNFMRGLGSTDAGCNSPEVYLDGALVFNPATLFATLSLETIDNIELLPPSEAGARFGTGAMWGTLIITTRKPWLEPREEAPSAGLGGPRRYDWSLEASPHPVRSALVASTVGNALGLAGGLWLAGQCIGFQGPGNALTSRCPGSGTLVAGVAAIGLPALGAALGARYGGATQRSRGTLGSALIGAAVALVPAYGLTVAAKRGDSPTLELAGAVSLGVGVPLVTVLADRLFRSRRPD